MGGKIVTSGAVALGVSLLAGAPGASGADARIAGERPLAPWATINICDTRKHHDAVGIAARMPGRGGEDTALGMRFRLQYRRAGRWTRLAGADSGWLQTGTGDVRSVARGWTFMVTPPPAGRTYVFRGAVTFRWVTHGDDPLTRTLVRVTRAGHPGTAGADPADHSAATCTVR